MKRIQLISSPRNISTALMYSFANRGDTAVIDEPYYAYYLVKTGKEHPGKKEIIKSQSLNISEVYHQLNTKDFDKPILFIKNMAKHFIDLDLDYVKDFINVFLIRNPYQLIASYASVVPNPSMEDIGARRQYQIFSELRSKGFNPLVIDSGEVLKNPQNVLRQLCDHLEIDFTDSMLHWEKGARKEDGIWAKYWYKNVHSSTGFARQKSSDRKLDDSLKDLYLEAKSYYEQLYNESIKAE